MFGLTLILVDNSPRYTNTMGEEAPGCETLKDRTGGDAAEHVGQNKVCTGFSTL